MKQRVIFKSKISNHTNNIKISLVFDITNKYYEIELLQRTWTQPTPKMERHATVYVYFRCLLRVHSANYDDYFYVQ